MTTFDYSPVYYLFELFAITLKQVFASQQCFRKVHIYHCNNNELLIMKRNDNFWLFCGKNKHFHIAKKRYCRREWQWHGSNPDASSNADVRGNVSTGIGDKLRGNNNTCSDVRISASLASTDASSGITPCAYATARDDAVAINARKSSATYSCTSKSSSAKSRVGTVRISVSSSNHSKVDSSISASHYTSLQTRGSVQCEEIRERVKENSQSICFHSYEWTRPQQPIQNVQRSKVCDYGSIASIDSRAQTTRLHHEFNAILISPSKRICINCWIFSILSTHNAHSSSYLWLSMSFSKQWSTSQWFVGRFSLPSSLDKRLKCSAQFNAFVTLHTLSVNTHLYKAIEQNVQFSM